MSHLVDKACALAHMVQPLVLEDKVLEMVVVGDALVLVLCNLVLQFYSCTFYMAVDNRVLLVDVQSAAHMFLVSLAMHGVDIYAQDGTLQVQKQQDLSLKQI